MLKFRYIEIWYIQNWDIYLTDGVFWGWFMYGDKVFTLLGWVMYGLDRVGDGGLGTWGYKNRGC